MGNDEKYSRAIKVPQYEPSESKPAMHELYNTSKYRLLMAKIRKSKVSKEEKEFLQFAATRHIVFNYAKIADYYAHSDVEMQQLMEESALVILDIDDAIANGYVALTEKMQQLIDEEKERDKKAKDAKDVLRRQRELFEAKAKEAKQKEKKQEEKKQDDKSADTENTEEVSE